MTMLQFQKLQAKIIFVDFQAVQRRASADADRNRKSTMN
jgi:hypothetical protein